ncbi:MAG TPA: hypothetical protein VIC05_06230 [Solirubrobacteraceae bacterium]|jgi:hypothetical protein
MLLAAGASELLPPATRDAALAFGGALFGGALGPCGGRERDRMGVLAIRPDAVYVPPMRPPVVHSGLVALGAALAAGGLLAYPLLTHESPSTIQGGKTPATGAGTLGRAIPPRIDPQLHVVSLNHPFVLSRAQVMIGAASLCRSGGSVQVDVPAAISAVKRGLAISEPEYQLLDGKGVPHQPIATVPVGAVSLSNGHAAPPPSVYRESITFQLPAASVTGTLQLQAVLPSGSGPEYRVTVVAQHSRSSRLEDLSAACASPGGRGV